MLSLRSRWLRLFEDVSNKEGVISNSVVAYSKRSYEWNMDYIAYVSRYRHTVWLDLWLVKLQIQWVGRKQKAPYA